jgi:hypothetical protein
VVAVVAVVAELAAVAKRWSPIAELVAVDVAAELVVCPCGTHA